MKRSLLAGLCLLAALTTATAQEWPTKPVRIIAPFAPASTPDTLARVLAQKLQTRLKQPFVVDNKPGAGGMLGTDAVAKAAPDGYTLGLSVVGPLVNNTQLYKKMPYAPERDLAPITVAVTQPSLLVVRSDSPAHNLAELMAELKKNPGKFNYSSIGNGSLSHLTMALIALKSGTDIIHVPYAGSSQAMLAVMSGDVQMAILPALSVLPQVNAGKLRVIAASTARRSSLLPDVPTLKEQGLADVDAGAWIGVVAPAAVPKPLQQRIYQEIAAVLKDPEVVQTLRGQMMEVVASPPEDFAAFMQEERERWTPVIVKNKITLD
ncbi:tripartite tricarboxylate transporter substrate binding protein [Xylophilus sp. GW821-FHT01B05]